jgi:anti-anti-sigma regulatory factor
MLGQGGDVMVSRSGVQAHIAYELIGEIEPKVVVIEFLSRELGSPIHAHELGEQLRSLIDPDSPRFFVLDLKNIRTLGSTGFGEILMFVREAVRVIVCNLPASLELGAAMIGLEDQVEFARDRQSAINTAIRASEWRHEAETEMVNFVL